jgi:hypothetical protein
MKYNHDTVFTEPSVTLGPYDRSLQPTIGLNHGGRLP